ncbi:hypothetical protein BpHYR1_046028 [Brachionus plicatilis]|uniref:Uncharacterized protein n=1 Tax=Brachionus plicatilis TaxID=10195 RepID=A0A3M7SC94_BRAPC|nr:hypothetical protein BpHYR1_046028 [Brachionus plicatilis]
MTFQIKKNKLEVGERIKNNDTTTHNINMNLLDKISDEIEYAYSNRYSNKFYSNILLFQKPKLTANGLESQPGEAVSDSSDEDTYEDYLDITVNQKTNIQINNTREIIYENEEEEEINHVELRIPAGVDTTQPKRGRGRPKKIVNDFQDTQLKKRAVLNNNQNDADHCFVFLSIIKFILLASSINPMPYNNAFVKSLVLPEHSKLFFYDRKFQWHNYSFRLRNRMSKMQMI